MQPKTAVNFDKASFSRLKRTIRNMSSTSRLRSEDASFATTIPDEVGIQLTNRCNLRCKHCFEWNEDGYHHGMEKQEQSQDISFDLVEKIFVETRAVRSNLYLWGGEPLSFGELDRLGNLMEQDPRWSVFCTNGIEVEKNMDALLKMSPNMAMLISVDGFQEENDAMRGKGTFQKVIKNIQLLLDLKKKGLYKGEVSVNCVISEPMIDKLYDFMLYFEELGVNTVYFCFPWYIPENSAKEMDEYFKAKFNWLYTLEAQKVPSWYSYTYCLDPALDAKILAALQKINSRVWNIRIRYQPALELEEVPAFLRGQDIPAQKRNQCLAISNRMNVMANGNVTACKLFHEFTIGNLHDESVYEVWNKEEMKKIRSTINEGLMPVCSKCILLYLHGK